MAMKQPRHSACAHIGTRGLLVGCLVALAAMAGPALAETRFVPGEVTTRPTWCCMGINWQFTGDSDRTPKVSLDYRRKGTAAWRPALPLWLHDYDKRLMFSGSVFRLAPGTEYEFRLVAINNDPSGGQTCDERIVIARTLDYPVLPGRVIDVPAGGLVEAQKIAAPGMVLRLPKGEFPGTVLATAGRPGQWIVYQGAPDGGTVITSRVYIQGDYVWLDGLTLKDPKNAVQGRSKGACITNCRITSHYCIHTGGGAENYFIADNRLVGDSGGKFTFSGEGVDFGGGELFRKIGYPDLVRKFGWDAHSIRVEWDKLFNEPIEPPTGNPRYSRDIVGYQITRDWQFNHPLLTPRADSPLIDAGTVLPNITGPHLGAAPDLGAHEAGLGTPWYGPRTWDAQTGMIYGVPEGWKKAPIASTTQYVDIGCPAATAGVLLIGEKPATYTLIREERRTGEDRWDRARQEAGDEAPLPPPRLRPGEQRACRGRRAVGDLRVQAVG